MREFFIDQIQKLSARLRDEQKKYAEATAKLMWQMEEDGDLKEALTVDGTYRWIKDPERTTVSSMINKINFVERVHKAGIGVSTEMKATLAKVAEALQSSDSETDVSPALN